MSGLFGVIGTIGDQELQAMAGRLLHRGPQTSIKEVADRVYLGCTHDEREPGILAEHACSMVADCWIDDERDNSDAPVHHGHRQLLAAFVQGGNQGFNRIGGQFAAVIWDDGSKQLILARDFTATIPLYYATLDDGRLLFASEYKSLLAVESLPATPDLDMMQRLQHYKHLPSEQNLIKEISAVPPGHVLVFDSHASLSDKYAFPALQLDVKDLSMEQASQTISSAFLAAVKRKAKGLDRIGIALSGGIDSIGVACACRQANPEAELYTFTAGSGLDDPEIKTASFVADKLGSTHFNITVTPDDIAQHIPGMVWAVENPIARTEVLQFYKLAQEAGKHVNNLFTGAAADGLFAGMPKHKLLWMMHAVPLLRGPLTEFYHLTQSGCKPRSMLGKLLDRLYFKGKVAPVPGIINSTFKPSLPAFPGNSKEFVNDALCQGFQEGVSQWLPKVERTLRSAGVTYTSPFLDRQVIQMAFSIPSAYKIHRGKEKYILRQALRSLVPAQVLQIPKFPMKMKHDSDFSDKLDAVADHYLSKERMEKRGFFRADDISRIRRRSPGSSYSSEGAMRVWTAVLTEVWAQLFIDHRGEKPS